LKNRPFKRQQNDSDAGAEPKKRPVMQHCTRPSNIVAGSDHADDEPGGIKHQHADYRTQLWR